MAEPAPATWTAATLTHTQLNTEVRDSVRWLMGHSSNPKPYFRRRSTASTSLTINTWTDVSMDTTVVSRGGWTLSGASCTVPVAGTYMVGGCVEISAAACNKTARIVNNSAVVVQHDITGVGTSALARINLSSLVVCAASDVLKLQAWVDLAGLTAVSAGEFSPVIWAYYVATAS